MAISSPGIGSNLDINGIISKLMQAESLPLQALAKKEASYQAKVSAFGNLSGALSSFQTALGNLNNQATFKAMNATPSDAALFTASATSAASASSYSINVAKLAQAQTLSSTGYASTTATIGSGATTKLTFQFGTLDSTGALTKTSAKLGAGVVSGGIAAGSLSINGTTIATDGTTNSAKALAAAINLQTGTTGVTATAASTTTAALGPFTGVTTGAGDSYTLNVGGVNIANVAASSSLSAAALDTAIADTSAGAVGAQLAAAGITVTGTAAAGTLQFIKSDGSNIDITQTLGGAATGGFGGFTSGVTQTTTASVTLSSTTTLTVGGSNPAAAGFTAGSGVRSFTQSANQPSASVTIDNTNNSLQGIRDAINKANIGVTASIVSDGSATNPHHLVIKSNNTGAESSMKISVQSGGDPALTSLLAYDHDPAGAPTTLTETSAAQSAALTVNGIAVTSQTNSVNGAIEGVSLDLVKTGSGTLNVANNTASVKSSVDAFVKAYNDLNSTIKKLTSYNSESKQAGILLGDSSVRDIEAQLRKMLSSPATGSNSTLKTLRDVGISISKEGTMSVDSSKLSAAMTKDLSDVGALFSSVGKTTDSLVSFVSAGSTSTPGAYEVYVSKLATQGKVAGSQDLRLSPITIDTSNRDLTVTVDGVTASVALTQGTGYTSGEIAALVQSAINGASELSAKGIAVSVTIDASGFLNIASNKYGSESKISVSGSSVAKLMGTATSTDGIDAAGIIGGVPAKGSGQYLTGADGSPSAGLKLQITGGAVDASRGLITFSKGYAFHLDKLVDGFLGDKGLVSGRTDGLKASIKDVGKQNALLNQRLADIEARYRKQFTALDVAISRMSSTSAYLSQQLAQISAQSSR
jgi:flagellar hook-associated protein 2